MGLKHLDVYITYWDMDDFVGRSKLFLNVIIIEGIWDTANYSVSYMDSYFVDNLVERFLMGTNCVVIYVSYVN